MDPWVGSRGWEVSRSCCAGAAAGLALGFASMVPWAQPLEIFHAVVIAVADVVALCARVGASGPIGHCGFALGARPLPHARPPGSPVAGHLAAFSAPHGHHYTTIRRHTSGIPRPGESIASAARIGGTVQRWSCRLQRTRHPGWLALMLPPPGVAELPAPSATGGWGGWASFRARRCATRRRIARNHVVSSEATRRPAPSRNRCSASTRPTVRRS